MFEVNGCTIDVRMFAWDFGAKEMPSGYSAEHELHCIHKNYHIQPILFLKYDERTYRRSDGTKAKDESKLCGRLLSVDISGRYLLWK